MFRIPFKVVTLWWLAAFGLFTLALDVLALFAGADTPLDPSGKLLLTLNALALAVLTLYGGVYLRRRLGRQTQEVQSLIAVSQALRANQGIESLLYTVHEQVSGLLDIEDFMVVLCETGGTLRAPLVVRGGHVTQSPPGVMWPAGTLIDHVLKTQAVLLLGRDVPAHARRLGLTPPEDAGGGWLGVPLLAGGRLLGALAVTWDRARRAPGAEQVAVLNVIAAAAAAAIENDQFYGQQAERVRQLATLNQVLNLLTETLSPDDVIDNVISSASAVSEATAIAVYRFTDDGPPQLVRSAGLSEAFTEAPPRPLLAPGWSAGDPGHPVVVSDIAHDARAAHLRRLLAREGKAAWVELPLVVGGRGLGVILVYFDTPQALHDETVELLRAFANQAAQAIQNAELYAGTYRALEDRVRQLSTLAAIGRELTATLDLNAIGQRLLDAALDAAGAEAGSVILLDETRTTPILHIHTGYPPDAFAAPEMVTAGITGRVLRTGQPAMRADVTADPDYVPAAPETRSQLTVPVVWRGDAVGAVTVESSRAGAFQDEQRAFLIQLANQVAIATENARLFGRVSEARDRMRAILDTMREPIILIDRQGVIALANPRVDLIGLDRQALPGRSVRDLLEDAASAAAMGFENARDLERLVRALRASAAPLMAEAHSYTVTAGGRDLYVQRQVIPVRGDRGDVIGVLLVFYNQTEQRELEQAREEFSRMIVHDLRSPLTAVTSSVMLLTEIVPPDNEYAPAIGKTASASQRAIRKLLNRVDSLLDISRMQSGQMALETEPADLDTLIDAVWNQLGPLAQELGVALLAQTHPASSLLDVDSDRIERVLLNLVDNALKFSPTGAQIIVRSFAPGAGGAEPHFCRIEVVDSGMGIVPEDRAYIFDRFAQIRGQRGRRRGSGLGLTFCKLTVEAHGGRIWVEDNPGGGSIFAFTLPVARVDRMHRTEELPSSESQLSDLLLDDGD